jgi:CheY-specific phosphatase CheX
MAESLELSTALVRQAVVEVLAEAAFMCAEPAEIAPTGDQLIESVVRFEGPRSGWISLTTSNAFACELAASIMGLDGDVALDAKAEDAHGEALNMISGILLHTWFGSEACFELHVPEVKRGGGPPPPSWQSQRQRSITLLVEDEHPLALRVVLDGGPAAAR